MGDAGITVHSASEHGAVPCTERGIALALTQGRGYNRKKKRVKVKKTGGRAHGDVFESGGWVV